MNKIEKQAACNNLLGKPDNLSVYIVLYYSKSNNKALTIKEIIEKVRKKFSIEITSNKVNYILKPFVEKDIIRKDIKNGIHKYYLHKEIYIPSQNTLIPPYQLVLLAIGVVVMFFNFAFVSDSLLKWVSLTFFGTLLLVVISHQYMFDYKH